ncbi:MAG: hypothetical protein ACYC9I_11290, partial [Desulfuromonadales bacterium]
YEVHALDVARFAKGEKTGNIDLKCLDEWRPRRPANVRIAAFRHDLPAIVSDLKAGTVRSRYPGQPSWLVFRQDGMQLEVTAVNAFGFDLLTRSDGTTDLAALAAQLQAAHGANRSAAAFLAACRDAAQQLAGLDLVEPGLRITPEEGR